MSKLEQLETEISHLSNKDRQLLRDRMDDMIEDELEVTDEFRASIERGQRDIEEGRVRIVRPKE